MPLILGILAQGVGAAPAGIPAYDLLETQVLSSSAASVTFTGLGSYSDYKHLQVRAAARTNLAASTSDILALRFNSDSGSNYAHHQIQANGSTVSSGSSTSSSYIYSMQLPGNSSTANAFTAGVLDILDFSSASKNTTTRSLSGKAESDNHIALRSGLWINTASVTAIELYTFLGGSLVAGSRFSLYGVK